MSDLIGFAELVALLFLVFSGLIGSVLFVGWLIGVLLGAG